MIGSVLYPKRYVAALARILFGALCAGQNRNYHVDCRFAPSQNLMIGIASATFVPLG